MADIMP